MTDVPRDIVELFIDSVTEHAAAKHLRDLRNEQKDGSQYLGAESRGAPLSAFDKEDFRVHLRNTLSDPETKYFIDDASGRMIFFNASDSNRSRIVFSPGQFNTDGHAGTLMRDKLIIEGETPFDLAAKRAGEITGVTPEIRSISDGLWIEHLEHYRANLENVPARVLGKGDVRSDFHQAADTVNSGPLLPLDYNAPNAPEAPDTAAGLIGKNGGIVTGVLFATGIAASDLVFGATPAQAAESFYETAVPFGESQIDLVHGDVNSAARAAVVEVASSVGFGVCAVPAGTAGAAVGTVVLPGPGTVVAAGASGLVAGTACAVGTGYVAGKMYDGVAFAAEATSYGINKSYDYLTGNTARMQAAYESLPVLDLAVGEQVLSAHPLAAYPVAFDMAMTKAQISTSQEYITGLQAGTVQPFPQKNLEESIVLLQGHIGRLQESFEQQFETAQDNGDLQQIASYVDVHGTAHLSATLTADKMPNAANDGQYSLIPQNRVAVGGL